jgi:isochorismate synthase
MNLIPQAALAYHSGKSFALVSVPGIRNHPKEIIFFGEQEDGSFKSADGREWLVQPFRETSEYQSTQPETTRKQHQELVENAKDHISRGAFEKVVVSRIKHLPHHQNPAVVFEKLVQLYPSAFSTWYHSPFHGTWFCATPELLLHQEGQTFYTMALAGTLPSLDSTSGNDWTEKEKHEQQLVTDFIVRQVKDAGASAVSAIGPLELTAGQLKHLKTEIQFNSDKKVTDLLSALHPTPAVCGTPRDKSYAFIVEHEPHQRRLYTGYSGVRSPKGSTFFVNLRCMQWFEDHAELYVGGGITAGSSSASEWNETELKALTLSTVLQ